MMDTLLTLIGGGLGGSLLTTGYNSIKNRIQKMECHYVEDDVLSKIPQKNVDDTIHQNLYYKTFKIKNTTNKDIQEFKIIFQFDSSASILECFSRSKEGYNRQKIRKNKTNNNEAEAIVRLFNRGDSIEYTFRIANVTENQYYITECNCMGFKLKCKDKRKSTNKSKSNQSDQILINRR